MVQAAGVRSMIEMLPKRDAKKRDVIKIQTIVACFEEERTDRVRDDSKLCS